jgi:hypothetical protein
MRGRRRSSDAGRGVAAAVRPSETTAARAQLGSRRFKTDDRDCAALVWLVRQGAGRVAEPQVLQALLGTVRHRAQLVDARRVLQQRLHDQLNALCPGLSAPPGHGRALKFESSTGQAVLACAAAFAGRAPSKRALLARAPGRTTDAAATFWSERWRRLLPAPSDAELRARRLAADLRRWKALQGDILLAEEQLASLLAQTLGRSSRRCPAWRSSGPLRSAPARCRSSASRVLNTSTLGHGPCPGELSVLDDHKTRADQPPGPARASQRPDGDRLGLSASSESFRARDAEFRARGFRPIQARVALARHACRLCWALFTPNIPTTIGATLALGGAGGDGLLGYAARRRNLACRPPAQPLLTAHTKACRTTAPDQPAEPQRPPSAPLRRFTQIPRSAIAAMICRHAQA